VKSISESRFNAFAGYARRPIAALTANEVEFFEVDDGRIVGMVVEDMTDRDFGGLVIAQDAHKRFRCVRITEFKPTIEEAREALAIEMAIAKQAPPEDFYQGDEQGEAVDFFAPVREQEVLNPDFVKLSVEDGYSPARSIIDPMMRWYEDADGNFVEQFQTSGFDQRIWELYLFATFTELGFEIDRSKNIPDFCCRGLFGEFTAEAVTVGPTKQGGKIVKPPNIESDKDRLDYLNNYMPIKFGSALYSKLGKKYWEYDHVQGKPFVLAIHDFSAPGSMVYTRSALEAYAFGFSHEFERSEDGTLRILPRKIVEHRWGDKIIPSGFFDQPDSENVSALLFSNSGTIAKFNRMGILNGFGNGNVLAVREGTMVNHDPSATMPKYFRVIVNSEGYEETWVEGLTVIHNPKAIIPLDPDLFPGACHLHLTEEGQVVSWTPDFFPFGSVTRHWAPVDVNAVLQGFGDGTHFVWTPKEGE